jgi:hypothetical protein
MMTRSIIGRVCLAVGICLLFLAVGTYQAQASCAGNTDCGDGGCVGSTPPNCAGRTCTDNEAWVGSYCWQCQCQPNTTYPLKCNCGL